MLYRTGVAFLLGLGSGVGSWLIVIFLTDGPYLDDFHEALLGGIAWVHSELSIPGSGTLLSTVQRQLKFSEDFIPFTPSIIGVLVFLLVFCKWRLGAAEGSLKKPSNIQRNVDNP